jgi:hypothetical protein
MDTQRLSAIARQVIAVVAIIMGALTAALPSISLPPGVSAVLVGFGGVVIALEHHLSGRGALTAPVAPSPPRNVPASADPPPLVPPTK